MVEQIAGELSAVELRGDVLRERLYAAIRAAVESGVSQNRVSRVVGVSRQRIGQIMILTQPEPTRSELDRERTRRLVADRRA